ncbi:MAG: DUF1553 domain-containing protein, partial [Planctomycetaceae bacterium]|nr:DUF1553 domain-containing protein [Planctomycetaceae bacterium]
KEHGMQRPTLFRLMILGLLTFPNFHIHAADLLPPDREVPAVVDHYIAEQLKSSETQTAPLASDLVILRRTTLDLAGRIPTLAEVEAYLTSTEPDKRVKLVDRLLSSPDFAFHHANELEAMLMETNTGDRDFLTYLQKAAAEDRPWDEMFRQIIVGNPDEDPEQHAMTFLKKRAGDADQMTNSTSRIFFGVAVNCAQCHDHPLVSDWKQEHYFGFKSFFDRTYQTARKTLAEKSYGEMKFKTVEGDERTAAFMFLTGAKIEEPKLELTKDQKKKADELVKKVMKDKEAAQPPIPEFSPRTELAKLALDEKNSRFFSRNIVNRIWARLMGQGLVTPLDQLHSENPPSHPQLLDWLTRYTVENGYHLKPLIRGIVLSDAYARQSRWEGQGDPPRKYLFAKAQTRVMTPKQYALSLYIASSSPEKFPLDVKPEDWAKTREGLENTASGLARQMEYPTEHFQVSVDEALYFSNNARVQSDFLRDSGDKLVGYLKSKEDPAEIIHNAFRVTLNREPEPAELSAFQEYIKQRAERPVEGLQQVAWALLTSPELRFNY